MVPLLTIGGRITKGFDFLGYSFEPKGLSIAPKTLANFLDRITQFYEQGADHALGNTSGTGGDGRRLNSLRTAP